MIVGRERGPMSTVSVRYIVTDIAAAVDFYVGRLGFEVQMHPNDLFAMLTRGDLRLVLVKPMDSGGPGGPGGGAPMPDGTLQQPGGWNRFSTEVTDIAAEVAGLRQAGAPVRHAIRTGIGRRQV